jgi:hypothetical protein
MSIIDTSENIDLLAASLIAAQAELKPVAKGSKGNYGKYADLGDILESVRSTLTTHDLCVLQLPMPGATEKELRLHTRLLHKSGQWIESITCINLTKFDAQGFGSAMTYARRYALAAMLGIAQADDDGEAAKASTNTSSVAWAVPSASLQKALDLAHSKGFASIDDATGALLGVEWAKIAHNPEQWAAFGKALQAYDPEAAK